MKKKTGEILMACMLLICAYLLPMCLQNGYLQTSAEVGYPECVIMIDAGHGAADSGKVGVNGALEKDINLSIAQKVKDYLEADGIQVVMSRTSDDPLYKETDNNKKLADMKERIRIMKEQKVQYLISIHQNSYSDSSVRGAQVFYYADSGEGEKLAQAIQDGFDYALGDANTRKIKGNRDYYLLLHSPAVAVICECGFLSNWEEAELLITDDYQEKVAVSIVNGIETYLGMETKAR